MVSERFARTGPVDRASLGLPELRGALAARERRQESVSRWSTGEHLRHCCLAIGAVRRALETSSGAPPRTWRSWIGWLVLQRGRLPRGRARAPEETVPGPEEDEPLESVLERAATDLERIRALPANAWFQHFALGTLRRDRALRFLAVHNEHHLRIVREILSGTEGETSPGPVAPPP